MIGGMVILRKKYSILEYTSAIMLSAGLCELTLGNAYSDPISFNALGTSVVCRPPLNALNQIIRE
jgi:hypothetical protein